MSSDAPSNLAESAGTAKEENLVAGRVDDDSLRLIDLARVLASYRSRDAFVVAAVMEKTRAILDAHGYPQPAKAS